MKMSDLLRYHENLNLIKNVKDNVILLSRKVLIFARLKSGIAICNLFMEGLLITLYRLYIRAWYRTIYVQNFFFSNNEDLGIFVFPTGEVINSDNFLSSLCFINLQAINWNSIFSDRKLRIVPLIQYFQIEN